jgi:glutathione S-transferase
MLKQLSNVELVGVPFSTFTRTIRLGLEEKAIPYRLILALPHTDEANKHHPFGRIPSFNFEYDGKKQTLIESAAIANFIDAICPETSLRPSRNSANLNDILTNARIDELISIGSCYIFNSVEPPIVKTRLKLEKNQKEEKEIVSSLTDPVQQLYEILTKLEQRSALKDNQKFLAGDNVTWADFFCYPPLADLRAINEGKCIKGESAQFIKLTAWMDRMETLKSVKNTMKDTLQDGWKPPDVRL